MSLTLPGRTEETVIHAISHVFEHRSQRLENLAEYLSSQEIAMNLLVEVADMLDYNKFYQSQETMSVICSLASLIKDEDVERCVVNLLPNFAPLWLPKSEEDLKQEAVAKKEYPGHEMEDQPKRIGLAACVPDVSKEYKGLDLLTDEEIYKKGSHSFLMRDMDSLQLSRFRHIFQERDGIGYHLDGDKKRLFDDLEMMYPHQASLMSDKMEKVSLKHFGDACKAINNYQSEAITAWAEKMSFNGLIDSYRVQALQHPDHLTPYGVAEYVIEHAKVDNRVPVSMVLKEINAHVTMAFFVDCARGGKFGK